VNQLVLRSVVEPRGSFMELLKECGRRVGGIQRQDVPFEKLVEELQPQRNLSRAPCSRSAGDRTSRGSNFRRQG